MKASDIAHLAPFEAALATAKTRADWWKAHFLKVGGLDAAFKFDRAAEEEQIALGRLAAARRYRGLPPE